MATEALKELISTEWQERHAIEAGEAHRADRLRAKALKLREKVAAVDPAGLEAYDNGRTP